MPGRAEVRPGRNGIGAEHVAEIQRARILAAMVDVVAERGAANVTVARVVTRSGVSRRTFYELFEDREDCFLAAFDQAVAADRGVRRPSVRAAVEVARADAGRALRAAPDPRR